MTLLTFVPFYAILIAMGTTLVVRWLVLWIHKITYDNEVIKKGVMLMISIADLVAVISLCFTAFKIGYHIGKNNIKK